MPAPKKTASKNTNPVKAFKPTIAQLKEAPARAQAILPILRKTYPQAACALVHKNPLQLLVSTILSAQCTDQRVNIVTKDLYQKYRTAQDFAQAPLPQLEAAIRSTGFFRNKAKNIKAAAQDIVTKHQGQVPATLEQLTALAGVGRKTANVVLGNAFNIPAVVTDTHVIRLSRLLALSKNSDPVKLEFDLMELFPQKHWTLLGHLLIFHGRAVCTARSPRCPDCPLLKHCPFGQKSIS
ncbi:MAG: endonuclease III [Sedimentisphaerales bacterium]|nr:endonuclease III [Sedimentisphaerales bacterium]